MFYINNSRVGGVLFLIVSCLYGYFANDIPLDFWSQQETFNARSMPRLIAAAGIVSSILLIVAPSPRTDWPIVARQHWAPAVLLLALMAAYGFLIEPFGFIVSTTAFLFAAFAVLGERRPLRMLMVALPLAAGFWFLMDSLGIYLEAGTLLRDALAAAGEG